MNRAAALVLLGLVAACADTASFGLAPVRCDPEPPGAHFVSIRERDPEAGDTVLCIDEGGVARLEAGSSQETVRIPEAVMADLRQAVDAARDFTFGVYDGDDEQAVTWRITAMARTAELADGAGPPELQALVRQAAAALAEARAGLPSGPRR